MNLGVFRTEEYFRTDRSVLKYSQGELNKSYLEQKNRENP